MHYLVYSGVVSSFYVVITSIDVIKKNQRGFEGGRYTCITVEPRCSRGLKDWQNLFVIERFISTYFTVTGKIISFFMEDLVILRFVISAFRCLTLSP